MNVVASFVDLRFYLSEKIVNLKQLKTKLSLCINHRVYTTILSHSGTVERGHTKSFRGPQMAPGPHFGHFWSPLIPKVKNKNAPFSTSCNAHPQNLVFFPVFPTSITQHTHVRPTHGQQSANTHTHTEKLLRKWTSVLRGYLKKHLHPSTHRSRGCVTFCVWSPKMSLGLVSEFESERK